MYDLLCEYYGSDAIEGLFILLLAVPLIGWRIAVAMEGKAVPGFWKAHVQSFGRVGISFGICCILFFGYSTQKDEQQQEQRQAVIELFTSISEALGSLSETILRNYLTPEEKKSRLLPVGLATNDTAWVAESQCVTSQVREAWQRVPIRRAAFRQTLPFPVSIGGNSYNEVFISSSGVIGFDAPKGSEITREMPYEEAADHVYLALLWGRIDFKPRLGSKMWCGVKEDGNFVASYDTVFIDGDTNAVAKVQVEFIANGDMILRYSDLPPCSTNAHVAGFQNLDGGWTLPFDNIRSNTALYLKSFGPLDLTVQDSDTDGDGISDYYELYPTNSISLTDPCNRDSDGDGLMDGEEVSLYATDPGAFSSDASGQGDLWRVLGGLGAEDAPYTNAAPSGSLGILTVTTLLENAPTNGGAVLRIADQYIPVLPGTTLVSRIAVPRDATNLFILARGVNCDNAIARITLESSTFTKIRDPSGALSGSFTLSPSCVTASGTVLMPYYAITPEFICFHSPTSSVLRIESADPDIYFNMGQGLVREYTPSKPENLPPGFTIGAVTGRLTCAGSSFTVLSNQFTKAAHFCNTEGPGGWEDPNDPDDREDWYCHTDVYGHVVEYPFTESDCPCIILYENAYDCFCSGRGVTPCPCGHAVCDPHATPADEPHDGSPYKQTRAHATLEIGGDTVFFPVTVPQGEYEPCPRCKCGMNQPLCAYAFRQTGNIDVAPLSLYTNGSFAVTGIHPSTNFAAEVLTVHLKDTYIQQSYTVLGTSVYPANTGHSVSNWFVGCGVTNTLTLWTGVKLPSDTGEVTLSVTVESGTPSPQLYVYNRIAQSNELLVTQDQLTFTQNLGDWRDTYCDTNGYAQAYLLCTSGGVGRVTHSFATYSGQPYELSAYTNQLFTVMSASIYSVMLDEGGRLILGTNGKVFPAVELGWDDVEACTYYPLSARGAPQMENVSALLGGIPEWVTFVETQGGAELTITKSEFEGFKTWELEYEGVTNGMPYYTWADGTNSYVRVTVTNTSVTVNTTNGTMGIRNLNLTIQDESFNLSTNEINITVGVYRDLENTSDYFSNYTLADPREDVGLPPFSQSNALVVRFNPMGMEGDFVCIATDEDDNETEIPLTQQPDGTYVSALIVPISELDGETDLGLESTVDVIRLKLYGLSGWEKVKINIGTVIESSTNKIIIGALIVRKPMLISAIVSNEENGLARANQAVVTAGEKAVLNLKYGVTPLFTPDMTQINEQLKRHSVWIHSGHGGATGGILITVKTGSQYKETLFKNSDIVDTSLEYDLVFMNTCESTDQKFIPQVPLPQYVSGWVQTNMPGHAVMDIGTALHAKNYVGWDCEIKRQLSVKIPAMLIQALDTTANGTTRANKDAVDEVRSKLRTDRPDFWWYETRLRAIEFDDTKFDLNKKPL
jgi:hypothetical protein